MSLSNFSVEMPRFTTKELADLLKQQSVSKADNVQLSVSQMPLGGNADDARVVAKPLKYNRVGKPSKR